MLTRGSGKAKEPVYTSCQSQVLFAVVEFRFVWGLLLNSYLDGVPVLAGEGVDGLLLETLLALGQSLVPIKKDPSALLSLYIASCSCPRNFERKNGPRWVVSGAPVLESGWLTHLPTAIFARSWSQRW